MHRSNSVGSPASGHAITTNWFSNPADSYATTADGDSGTQHYSTADGRRSLRTDGWRDHHYSGRHHQFNDEFRCRAGKQTLGPNHSITVRPSGIKFVDVIQYGK